MSGVDVFLVAVIAFFLGVLLGMLFMAWGEFSRQHPEYKRVRTSRWADE